MIKIVILLLNLLFMKTAIAEPQDITVEAINQGQLATEVVAEIRQDCSSLAESEEIEAEYFLGFVEVCVIDNVVMAIADEQGAEITDEMPVEEYIEVALSEESPTMIAE